MAESSSNSSTTSTSSNSGAAAPGSQTSSNGSFSTGNGNNGNSNAGPGLSFGAGLASNTGSGWTSNSNGNFGGGGPNSTTTGFTGFASDNFGQGWGGSYSISPDSEGKYTIKPNAEGKHVVTQKYSKPQSQALYMTVDEVYGKGNHSMVENQGDYDASSNEKSNVETSTFGKQDEISVTPVSVTKDEGLVNNDAIQSVEGLNFQQKDKANQEVMEAKKSRDDAEAEDNADGMRNQLKAVVEKGAEETEDNNTFQIGEKNTFEEENSAKLTELNNLKNDLNEVNKSLEESKSAKLEADKKAEQAEQNYQEVLSKKGQADSLAQDFTSRLEQLNDNPVTNFLAKTGIVNISSYVDSLKSNITKMTEEYGIEVGDISKASITELKAIGKKVTDGVSAKFDQYLKTAENELAIAQKQQKDLEANQNTLMSKAKELESRYTKAQEDYKTFESEYWADAKKKSEEAPTVTEEAPNSKEKAAFIEAEKAYKDIEVKVAEKEAELAKAEEEFNDLDNAWFEVHQPRLNAAKDALNDVIAAATRDNEENGKTDPTYDISYLAEVAANPEDYADAAKVAEQLNDVPGLQGNKYLSNIKQCVEDVARVSKDFYEVSQKHEEAQQRYNQLTYELADLMGSKEKAEAAYNKAKESYDSNFIAENPADKELPAWVKEVPLEEAEVAYDEAKEDEIAYDEAKKSNELPAGVEVVSLEKAPTVETETPTTEAPSYKADIAAARNEINNSKDLTDEQKSGADTVLGNVESAAEAAEEAASDLAANPNDAGIITTYQKATETLIGALKDAKGDKTLENTDFNKTFTRAVAAAINKSKVTMPDGSTKNLAEFMAETVTRSPELAKGLYEAKAKQQEEDGHKILAAINRTKAKMVMTWLGSKFTFADNQVRNQFNQMAKTDIRATYATYNNVLNDPNATPEKKAEASAAIQQANSLMTASVALQASTGFFSGIGDGTSDGEYGVTDPGKLNNYQKALNAASNLAKVALGLGVTPGANEAYQNMYYMARAKVEDSVLFDRDWDGDGFALCQEYGNNAAVGMIAGAGELATGVALMFSPATSKLGLNLTIDAAQTFFDALYGVQKEVNKSIKYSSEVLNYFNEAKNIASVTGNIEAISTMDSAIKQIEDFQLKSDEVGDLDNWLEGSGSNTADNGKFNQALSYDEWLKLIKADPVMQEYAKSLNR